MRRSIPSMLGLALSVAVAPMGCGDDSDGSRISEQYTNLDNWLCHPERDAAEDVCASADLDATVVEADGTTTVQAHEPADAPQVDCFYVYPTVSLDSTPNSDLDPSVEETFITAQQAARFNSMCRVFAPLYRQVTLTALFSGGMDADRDLAYGDVRDAFFHYLATENDGRGVLLIGHSQGSGHLSRLMAEEIEADADLADRMIAAYLLGTTVAVPEGEDVGGSLQSTPLCRESNETGCVVTYASYRETEPPGAEGLFGATGEAGTRAGCTNPAMLAGGAAITEPYFPRELPGVFESFVESGPGPFADPEDDTVTTPFFVMPDFIEAECVQQDDYDYLEIRVLDDPEDPRADDIGGDFMAGWGLHVIDAHLAMGDLIALAESQAAAWLAEH
ncbi:MAG: DUF3089 domain-containing protein [Myxococcota bacterium]